MRLILLPLIFIALPGVAENAATARNLECAGAFSIVIKADDAGTPIYSGLYGDQLGLGMKTYGEALRKDWEASGTSMQDAETILDDARNRMNNLFEYDDQKFRKLIKGCFEDIS